ncbi:MAG: class I SAM-dependent methyltransferase [Candidatus Latescibacteria bacterium]|jgi:ubiquinone/menaquinone biosynthesis C-methylase UbiE|nr:class I SAM-dependent methyltransferase [Candidatus Latescibacterota bacterium]
MIEKIEQEIGCFFDECAKQGFMESFSEEELPKLKEALKRWDIRPGQHILEPGCGSGRLTEYLSRAVDAEGEVYACDISTEMIRLARKRSLPGNVMFVQASVNSIPREDNFFDSVICFQVFPHFTDQTRSLSEIARVLKPRGNLRIEHFKSRDTINSVHKEASGVIVSHIIPPDEKMRRLLNRTGFEVVGIQDSPQRYCVHAVKIKFC